MLCFTTVNRAFLVGCLRVKVFILTTLNKKWQRLICSINTGRASKVYLCCERACSWEQCCLCYVLVNLNKSGLKQIPRCEGWEGRSVLGGEEYWIKHKAAFVIFLSKPGDSVFDAQRKLKVCLFLPIWEEGDWDKTSLLCFLWEAFSTSWKPVSYISPWKGTLEYTDTVRGS